jgi:ARG/rhodanese/phosphatase superfamily protein
MKRGFCATGIVLSVLGIAMAGQMKGPIPHYKVLPPITHGNFALFPVVGETSFHTEAFLTLDEGISSGQVIVTERSQTSGLVRPRHAGPDIWPEPPIAIPRSGASVNELVLINNADRPLILLAGEIVTGGKQDRVVGRDRIIRPHSDPIALGVFCVEPHRWRETSAQFGGLAFSMAQPSLRLKAMASQNQQEVWSEVAKSRAAFAMTLAAPEARALESSSSYAMAVQNGAVKRQIDSIAVPIGQSYEKMIQRLRAEKAVGAVVFINGEPIWADVFASSSLLEKYWPKLIRSYAAEALRPAVVPTTNLPSQNMAQKFIDNFDSRRNNIETEPGVYSNTEITGDDFDAFVLTSLLPNTGFQVHIAKMRH